MGQDGGTTVRRQVVAEADEIGLFGEIHDQVVNGGLGVHLLHIDRGDVAAMVGDNGGDPAERAGPVGQGDPEPHQVAHSLTVA